MVQDKMYGYNRILIGSHTRIRRLSVVTETVYGGKGL